MMNFDFYTLGGNFFWEDVFFYQKWRIQRHYKKKTYRLLDNWDIRRFQGSFGQCYDSFLKYIEICEIAKQSGHMVIMLPSFIESKNVFKPLWREVLKKGYLVAALNYPATLKNSDSHAKQINFFLNHLEDVDKISFVAKGAAVMVLEKVLKSDEPWKNKLKLENIVTINSPESVSTQYKNLLRNPLAHKIFGPMTSEYIKYKSTSKAPNVKLVRFNKPNISEIIKKL